MNKKRQKETCKNQTKKLTLENGFIYLLVSFIIERLLFKLNIVEWFKLLICKLCQRMGFDASVEAEKRIAADLYILLKYAFILLCIFISGSSNVFFFYVKNITVIYLLIMNIYTYFYYHLWVDRNDSSIQRQRRRFVNIILAIGYNILSFVYLFFRGFSGRIIWGGNIPEKIGDFVQFSISNTFILSSPFEVINRTGNMLQISQYLVSFLFLAILLSQSIPAPRSTS